MIVFYFFVLFIILVLSKYTFQKRSDKKALFYSIGLLFQAIWIIAFILEIMGHTENEKLFWDTFILIGMYGYLTFFFIFAMIFNGFEYNKYAKLYNGFIILSFFIILPICCFPTSDFIRSGIILEHAGDFILIGYVNGIYLELVLYQAYSLIAIMLIIFHVNFLKINTKRFKKQSMLMLTGFIFPVIATLVSIFGYDYGLFQNLISIVLISFVFASIFIYGVIFKLKTFDVRIFAHQLILEQIAEGYCIIDKNDCIVEINPFLLNKLGKSIDVHWEGKEYTELFEDYEEILNICSKKGEDIDEISFKIAQEEFFYEVKKYNISDNALNLIGYTLIFQDISTSKQFENYLIKSQQNMKEKYLQAHKMESIGKLSSGIAHDFNNILTIIIGNTELALLTEDGNPAIKKYLSEISSATETASRLTKQLLNFSRKKFIKKEIININLLLNRMENFLKRLIGENFSIFITTNKHIDNITADLGLIEQIIINLITNARDAMPNGGSLKIDTDMVEITDDNTFLYPDIKLGIYVILSISDEGIGINKNVREHLFEDYFTTKPPGKGSGLGLSTVYSAIRQNKGFIKVISEVDKGSTFMIFLPSIKPSKLINPMEKNKEYPRGNGELIILVEDDDLVRKTTIGMIKKLNYQYLAFSNGQDAMNAIDKLKNGFDLLLTDIIMPEMNGKELYEEIKKKNPGIKYLFFSGYTGTILQKYEITGENAHFISKPFKLIEIARKIHKILFPSN